MKTVLPFAVWLPALILLACGGGGDNGAASGSSQYTYSVPADLSDGWPVGHVSDAALSETMISQASQSILDGTYTGIDSLVIVRNGVLVHEVYSRGFAGTPHDRRSATKSITSLLVGIAIDQGHVASVGDPVLPYIHGYASFDNWDDRKNNLSVQDLLTMSTGLDCDDWRSSTGNEANMYRQSDWVKFILDLPMVTDPGTEFSYCTGGVVVLGAIIAHASALPTEEFAEANLFGPLGISNNRWEFTPSGRVDTGGHIRMTSRDMAKIGELVLRRGHWDGTQIVSDTWIDESTGYHLTINANDDYGYLWWRRTIGPADELDTVYASGNGGQFIFVIPDVNMIVIFNGTNYNSSLQNQPYEILDRFIVPAIQN